MVTIYTSGATRGSIRDRLFQHVDCTLGWIKKKRKKKNIPSQWGHFLSSVTGWNEEANQIRFTILWYFQASHPLLSCKELNIKMEKTKTLKFKYSKITSRSHSLPIICKKKIKIDEEPGGECREIFIISPELMTYLPLEEIFLISSKHGERYFGHLMSELSKHKCGDKRLKSVYTWKSSIEGVERWVDMRRLCHWWSVFLVSELSILAAWSSWKFLMRDMDPKALVR